MYNICECGSVLKSEEFQDNIIWYCLDCGFHETINKICTHEKTPIKVQISNGNFQIRLYCPICKKLDSKSQSHDKYKGLKLHETTLEKYRNFRDKISKDEQPRYEEILSKVRLKKYNSINDNYRDYIKSDQWKTLRKEILERDEYTCQICGGVAEQVHHLTYDHLRNEYHFELVSLCKNCHHDKYHFKKSNGFDQDQ